MPRIEELRHRVALALASFRLRLASVGAMARGRRLVPRPRAVLLLFPLAVCLAITSIVFAIRAAGHGPNCTPVIQVSAATTHPANSKLCRTPLGYMGHLAARLVST